ncbi:MAG: histidinol-phosphate aminotransferase family protein [Rhodothermaceae bacterium]|nr:histidinol-phosphate aminotransferase family protein [Rhodothermaceae bacterium]MXX58247.1 histidinol-phosphate aminotransferase family protein [Rhodothermaceae bacterium]MYD18679.1 histidinol-phosphate aminotransferase family protein [Rhodothermaceae bacterium]MYD57955.1 histidinol-phosphate aminotransferase family protein [Rhodothermaceae bacterium]MYI44120.1 histidinol-phosphate aminotransferase family protein [Rhodothermaceae bacterium]
MSISRRDWLRLSAVGAALPFLPIPGFATHRRDDPIRLHSNENPYAPAQSARTAVLEALNETNLYAGSAVAQNLEAMIAAREGLRPEHVVLGAGSTEVLRMAALAYGLSGGEVVTGYPTYEGMETSAKSIDARVHRVPLKSDKSLDLSAMDMRTTKDVKLVFVCNPNNPTGSICDKEELNDFCLEVSKRCTILVDEAYYELVNHPRYSTAVPLVKAGANVIVSRTFSKVYGLAGLRVGYAIARPDIAERLRTHRTPMAVNILGLRAAIASLNDERFLHYSKTQLEAGRNQITAALRGWGHEVIESHTNFVFFHLGREIEEFQRSMASQGILVGRPFPPFLDWCRLSIGNEEEMARFMEVFPKVMNSPTR